MPPDGGVLRDAIRASILTFDTALLGTACALVLSLLLVPLAARNIAPHRLAYEGARLVIGILRAIPDFVFALIFLVAVGITPYSIVLAIGAHTVGVLGKLFAEAVEDMDMGPVDALRAAGAGRLQVFLHAVLPGIAATFTGLALYRLDTNVRSALYLGAFGGGGLGFMLFNSMQLFQYRQATTELAVLLVLLLVVERVSLLLRQRIVCAAERRCALDGDVVRVVLADGTRVALHVLALRDGCPCAECRHPVSGQRLFESSRVLPDLRASAVAVSRRRARSCSTGKAATAAASPPGGFAPRPRRLRAGAGRGRPAALGRRAGGVAPLAPLAGGRRATPGRARPGCATRRCSGSRSCTAFRASRASSSASPSCSAPSARRTTAASSTSAVAVGATNLADTALPLSPHTDNPYREPTPTLQLLHCLATDVEGGQTVLVDGFAAVEKLRAELATAARRTRARADPLRLPRRRRRTRGRRSGRLARRAGTPVALHLNNRSKGIPHGDPARVADWYDAYLALLRLVESPELQVVLRLEPGDLVLFDNLRLLHGRTGFASTGTRRLQGCYADRDGLLSTLAVLGRATA